MYQLFTNATWLWDRDSMQTIEPVQPIATLSYACDKCVGDDFGKLEKSKCHYSIIMPKILNFLIMKDLLRTSAVFYIGPVKMSLGCRSLRKKVNAMSETA